MIDVSFACGHRAKVSGDTQPCCPECGHTQIRSVKARAPRFVGVATGPYCTYKALDAIPVSVAPKGPLTLKEQD